MRISYVNFPKGQGFLKRPKERGRKMSENDARCKLSLVGDLGVVSHSFSPVWAQKLEIVPQQFAWGLGIFHKNQSLASQFIIYVLALVLRLETFSQFDAKPLIKCKAVVIWPVAFNNENCQREGRRESTREN